MLDPSKFDVVLDALDVADGVASLEASFWQLCFVTKVMERQGFRVQGV